MIQQDVHVGAPISGKIEIRTVAKAACCAQLLHICLVS